MIIYVLPIITAYALLFAANGIWNGWRIAYDVNLAITSPADGKVRLAWLAWPLSVAGWLLMPVLAGAVVGYVVNTSLDRRRVKGEEPREDLPGRGRARFEWMPYLRDRGYTAHYDIPEGFINYFLGLHDGDWNVTEEHFSREVQDNLNRDVVRPHDRQWVAMRLAVAASVKVLWETRSSDYDEHSSEVNTKPRGVCPHCPGDHDSSANGR